MGRWTGMMCLLLGLVACAGERTFEGLTKEQWRQELGHMDFASRIRAVRAVAQLARDDPSLLPSLAFALADPTEPVREEAGRALVGLGPMAHGVLVGALLGTDQLAREQAEQALATLGPSAAGALGAAMPQAGPGQRLVLLRALGRSSSGAALPALRTALADEDANVRSTAAMGLARLGKRQIVPSLCDHPVHALDRTAL